MHKSRILFVNSQEVRCGRCKAANIGIGPLPAPDCAHEWLGFSTDEFQHDYVKGDAFDVTGNGGPFLDFVPRTDIAWL